MPEYYLITLNTSMDQLARRQKGRQKPWRENLRRPVLLTFFVDSNKTWGKLKTARDISCIFIAFPRSFPSSEERAENFKNPKVLARRQRGRSCTIENLNGSISVISKYYQNITPFNYCFPIPWGFNRQEAKVKLTCN